MLENLNNSLFYLINATPDSAQWMISLAIFIAKDLINIVPLLAVVLWLWGPRARVTLQRQLVIKMAIALIVGLTISWLMGHLFPHDRPFVNHIGYNFLHHAADDSFPSDHGTVIFTFALAFLVLASPVDGRSADGRCCGNCLVAGLPWRTLAAGYAGRTTRRTDWLPERPDDLAAVWYAPVPRLAKLLSRLLRSAHP